MMKGQTSLQQRAAPPGAGFKPWVPHYTHLHMFLSPSADR